VKANQKLTLISLLKSRNASLILPLLLGLIASMAAIGLLATSGWFITAAGLAGLLGTTAAFNFFTPGALVRLMAMLRTAGRYFEQLSAHYHLMNLLKDLRLWSWSQLVSHPITGSRRIGDFLQRVVGDVELINRWPLQVWMPWCYAVTAAGIYLAAIAVFIPKLLWLNAISFASMLWIIPLLCSRAGKRSIWQLQLLSTYRRSRFINLFGALVTLTIRGHWRDYAQRLTTLDERQFGLESRVQSIAITGRYLISTLTALTLGASFYVARPGVINGEIDGPTLAGFMFALLGLNELFAPLASTFMGTNQTRVGMRRLNQLRHGAAQTPAQPPSAEPLTSIRLRQVSVKRQGAVNGIDELNLELMPGSQVWLCGPSGCGKSTLLDALANQVDINGGELDFNHKLQTLAQRERFQHRIGYLNQAPYIFNQSIAANLRLGDPDASDEQLMAALKAVALDQWIQSLPYGLDTLLGEQGSNISGGQARRLGLARVLIQKPDLMLLDEPFEGLDNASIQRIGDALQSTCRPPILVIASHLRTPLLEQMQRLDLSKLHG
jgi:ATP-binding cassette subfamily C protein CydC